MADYYKFKNNQNQKAQYQSSVFGKVAICITTPAVIITIISLILSFMKVKVFGVNAFAIVIIAAGVTILGCIMIAIDIVIFNRRQAKENPSGKSEPKGMDIGRMVHLLLGIVVGIIIGYLIWGAKFGPR
ncbi:MAG: hypothetical protein K6E58_06230 [Eubacterium sp.]|nr:hypothetical protein [Eubacterium sp.]